MARLNAGHEEALDDLMERHAPAVFQFLCRMLGDEAEAEDLAQDTFTRVFQYRARFRPDAKFSTWLYTIAGNLARNHYRWRSRHPTVSLENPTGSAQPGWAESIPAQAAAPDQTVLRLERAAAVRAAVERLPADLREAIVLCEWQDLALAEAAAILNTTAKAVELRLYRGRKLLREALRKWL